jgi:dGTPase
MFQFEGLPLLKDKLEENYASILSPFATVRPLADGREIYEEERDKENRSEFQRDRDRIIHSKAFRRLMYKTQVFVNHEGDHFRTRMTHSLEVAQFARGICKSLGLNEELAEAIALGHDLGHTPFGHAAERFLDEELNKRNLGRFCHNEQSVRIVDHIEKRCNEYSGLNLTYEVREGILKHTKDTSGIYKNLNSEETCSTLEGQVVNIVDTIAYVCHDLQDGIISGLVEDSMNKNKEVAIYLKKLVEIIASILECKTTDIDVTRYSDTFFIGDLIHKLIMKITNNSVSQLIKYNINTQAAAKREAKNGITIITFDPITNEIFKTMKNLVRQTVYNLHTIIAMDEKAVRVASDLFEAYTNKPMLLPPDWYYRYKNPEISDNYAGAPNDKIRIICDYISTMTDRFALDEHERLYNPRIRI